MLALDKDTLTLRTAWADALTLPRTSVSAIVQIPGSMTLVEDAFREGLKGWKPVGKPHFDDNGMSLTDAGHALVYTPPTAVEAGSMILAFRDEGEASGAAWTCAFTFAVKDKERTLSVTVVGANTIYEVTATGLKGTAL